MYFAESVFDEHTKLVLSPTRYWQYAASRCQLPDAKKFCLFMRDIFSCPSSSAGLERLFSSFGLVHTKWQNRLGNEKVAKLVKVYCHLRDKNNEQSMVDSVDDIEFLSSESVDEEDVQITN